MVKNGEKDIGLLFVYGTLKVDTGPEAFARYFDGVRLGSKPATVKGALYDMGYFPGVVFGGSDDVHGELHRYSDFEKVIAAMDRIEGYIGAGNPDNLYDRIKVVVLIDVNETAVTATAYEFALSVIGYPRVKDGIWEIDKSILIGEGE